MEDETETDSGFTVPKYIRFARSLALVSGVTLGVAAGATVFTAAGCGQSCAGVCHLYGVAPANDASQPKDASAGPATDGASPDRTSSDGTLADGGTSGGPRPAPPFPATWLA
jgi:hypothetical protein